MAATAETAGARKDLRRKIWVHPFQTGLLVRILAYCLIYQAASWGFIAICEQVRTTFAQVTGPGTFAESFLVRSVLVLVVLLPPLTLDAVRFAHRLVGPLYRFRKTMQAIAAGEPVSLVRLRDGDMLQDFKDDFNAMLEALQRQGFVLAKPGEAAAGPEHANPSSAQGPPTETPRDAHRPHTDAPSPHAKADAAIPSS